MATIKQITSLYPHSNIIVADISSFFTSPYKAAIDMATQIDEDALNTINQMIKAPWVTKQYNYQTDYWVDIESIGNITAIKTKELVAFLSAKITENTLLVVNLNHSALDDDNALFFEFLRRYLPNLTIHFNSTENQENSPSYYLIHQEQKNLSYLIDDVLVLNNKLIFIEVRDSSAKQYYQNKLSAFVTNNNAVLPEEIIQHAWSAAYVGAIHLATRLLKQYYNESKNMAYLAHLQYIRLVSGYFHDVVNEPYEDFTGDPLLLNRLFYAKAYCAVLTNNIEVAGIYFQKMGMHADKSLSDLQSLYHANIYALYQHRLGNLQTASDLEHRIESQLDSDNEIHTQIRYINSLNLARLYRFMGDVEKARYYFDLAYQSINGVMLEADYVYRNVNYASLYEKTGDIKNAFHCWLRATLHWMAMRYPESLGWRISRAILRKEMHPGKALPLDEVSNVFYKNLHALAERLNLDFEERDVDVDLYIKQVKYFDGNFEQAQYYGKDNQVGFIGAVSSLTDEWCYHQPRELKQLVLKCLAALHCLPDVKHCNTLVIDTDHDTEMPIMFHQAIKRCIFLNIPTLNWDETVIDIAKYKEELLKGVMIKLSPSQASLTTEDQQQRVVYKRYKQNILIQPEVSTLLKDMKKHTYIDAVKQFTSKILQDLEREKIIYFDFDPEKMPDFV